MGFLNIKDLRNVANPKSVKEFTFSIKKILTYKTEWKA